MAALRSLKGGEGQYSITSPGISYRISTSALSFGAALSKAQTIGGRLQRELKASKEEDVTLSIRPIGGDPVARIIVSREVIATYTLT